MTNREITFYSLSNPQNLWNIERIADTMDKETFVSLGYDEKWLYHLWIKPNNKAFLEIVSEKEDLNRLDLFLGEQLKLYSEKKGAGYEKDKGDFFKTFQALEDWLRHTVFICKKEFNKTSNEVYNEVVKWCTEWEKEYLSHHNPYSPHEIARMQKAMSKPLWQQLQEEEDWYSSEVEHIDIQYSAKHYVLTYLLECRSKNENPPQGQKKVLEKIGDRMMGFKKGNRFYKVFNQLINKDLSEEVQLSQIAGPSWRKIVLDISEEPHLIEKYLADIGL